MTTRARLGAISTAAALVLPLTAGTALAGSSFQPYQIYAVPSQAEAVAVGDVTGDGLADIVFTTMYDDDPANDFDLFVLPQEGAGHGPFQHYQTVGSYTERPESLELGDVTGDGRVDVIVGIAERGIEVFPGLADGTLGASMLTATLDGDRVALGTFDANPGLDVAALGWGSDTVTTFSGGPSGLTKIATYAALHDGYDDLEVGDVSGDGRDDLVVMSGQGTVPNLSVLTQLAGGGFGAAATYSVGTGAFKLTHGIGLGDVTGDGRNDVVASYGGNAPSSMIAVFAQTAGGTLAAPVSYPSFDIPEPVEVGDLDFDGRNEVVVVHGGWSIVGVFGGRSDGTLDPESRNSVTYASHYNPQGVAIGDINGDGSPDIIEADYNFGLIVLLNTMPAPAPRAPSAPTLTTATGGDRTVTLAWNIPASNGGSPITSYTATLSPGGATCTTASTSCAIGGLANGTTYTATVRATNAVGVSPASAPLSVTPRTVPSAPRTLTAKAAGTGVTLKWLAPTSNGGGAISGYRVYRGASSTSGTLLATVSPGALSFVDTTAPKKATSSYWVTAVNVAGESPKSNVVSVRR